jgi:hypothetical protein
MEYVHDEAVQPFLEERAVIWSLLNLFDNPASLEVDFTNAYCPFVCCWELEVN